MHVVITRIQLSKMTFIQRVTWRLLLFMTRFLKANGLHHIKSIKQQDSHWLLQVWKSKTDMIQFRQSKHHRHFIGNVRGTMHAVRNVDFENDDVPDWGEALDRFHASSLNHSSSPVPGTK